MNKFLKNIKDKFVKGSFAGNLFIMAGGRIVSQTIPIIVTPILTRIYTPEEFGIFAIFSSMVALVSVVSNGRYNLAVMLPKEDERAKIIVLGSDFVASIVVMVITFCLLFLGKDFFISINAQELYDYWYLIGFVSLLFVLYEDIFYYCLRKKEYKIIARGSLIQTFILVAFRLLFGFIGYTKYGLIYSYLLGVFVGYVYLFFVCGISAKERFKLFNIKNIKEVLLKYIKFPKYSLLADTIYTVNSSSPSLFFNKYFGNQVAGIYSMSEKILGSPLWFITSSVGDVFKQEASEKYRDTGTCKFIFINTAKNLFLFGLLPFFMIFILSPIVIPFLLGENWSEAGNYVRILSIMYFARFVVSPVSYVVYILEKQKYNLFFQILLFCDIVVAFLLGFLLKDVYLGLKIWVSLATLSYILIFIISYNLVNGEIPRKS